MKLLKWFRLLAESIACIFLLVYLFPTYLACDKVIYAKQHFWFNVLAGWTGIGWLLSMYLAYKLPLVANYNNSQGAKPENRWKSPKFSRPQANISTGQSAPVQSALIGHPV